MTNDEQGMKLYHVRSGYQDRGGVEELLFVGMVQAPSKLAAAQVAASHQRMSKGLRVDPDSEEMLEIDVETTSTTQFLDDGQEFFFEVTPVTAPALQWTPTDDVPEDDEDEGEEDDDEEDD